MRGISVERPAAMKAFFRSESSSVRRAVRTGKKHTDRTRLSPSSRGFRENQRQSKGVKEAWAGRFHKQRESGNQILFKSEHVNGVGGPWFACAGTGIHRESRLTVGSGW